MTGRERRELIRERRGKLRVGVPEHGHAVVAHRIEIALAVGIEEIASLAAHERDIAFRVQRGLMVGLELLNRF